MTEAIVLAGGLGTRLRELVPDRQKAMAAVAGRPLLERILLRLAASGYRHVVLALGYRAGDVVQHFDHRFDGVELTFSIETTPLGTGGAIRLAMARCREDHVLVLNGDTYLELDLAAVDDEWRRTHDPIIVARAVRDTSRYGRLETAGGFVVAFREKGASGPGLINAGAYVLPCGLAREFPATPAFSLEREFLPDAVLRQRFRVFVTDGTFVDIGVPDDYRRAQDVLRDMPS